MTIAGGAGDKDMRIVFAGTPDFAQQQLQALLEQSQSVVAVYTQPDRKAGRGKKLQPTPVKALALEHQLPVFQPDSLRSPQAQQQLAELRPDLMVVAAYGMLLPPAVLCIPVHGCINIHASLLPRWRGAAPIERAIEAGDPESGITIMQMDEGLDTGAILNTVTCPIESDTTGDSLRRQLSELAPGALAVALQQLRSKQQVVTEQDDQHCTYANKLNRAEAWLDWSQSASQLARKIRAFCSSNVCCSELTGERIKIWMAQSVEGEAQQPPGTIVHSDKHAIHVACGEGVLAISVLQLPGRKALSAGAILNARKALFDNGQRFSSVDKT